MRNRINGPYNINDHKPSYELEVGQKHWEGLADSWANRNGERDKEW